MELRQNARFRVTIAYNLPHVTSGLISKLDRACSKKDFIETLVPSS